MRPQTLRPQTLRPQTLRACALIAGLAAVAAPAFAKDYLLAPVRPNKLVVVDAEAMAVDKVIEVDAEGPTPFVPVVDAAGEFAYVNMNRTETIAKVSLLTGETVATRDLSTSDMRVKTLFGMDLSPDGETLAVYESPVRLHPTRYEVMPTRISILDAETLETLRSFPAPRQITLLAYSSDGATLYGLGRALYVFDAATGAQGEATPVQSWRSDAYLPVDVLDVWSQFETAGMIVAPFYTARSDMSLDDPEAWRTGILTLDLDTGAVEMEDVRMLDVFYFSMAASPDGKRAYGAYNVLESFDLEADAPIKRTALPHSYYTVNVSSDGETVWLGGTLSDLAAYDAETLERIGQVDMPGGAAMGLASVRLFQRDAR